MAKLFKSSVFLVLSALVLVAEGFHHLHSATDTGDSSSLGLSKIKGLVSIKQVDGGNADNGDNNVDNDNGGNENNGGDGCNCGDDKFRDFMNKLAILYRNYASKELIPELKAMAYKLIDFTLNYLAKEKPDEVSKFHGFVQRTAKVTGSAITKTGGTVSE